MKKILLIIASVISLTSCVMRDSTEDSTTAVTNATRINELHMFIYEFQYKGHTYIQFSNRGSEIIHAPHCSCQQKPEEIGSYY